MLQPTSPLRFSKDIDEAIETLINEKAKVFLAPQCNQVSFEKKIKKSLSN